MATVTQTSTKTKARAKTKAKSEPKKREMVYLDIESNPNCNEMMTRLEKALPPHIADEEIRVLYDDKKIRMPIQINDRWFVTLDDLKDSKIQELPFDKLADEVMAKHVYSYDTDAMNNNEFDIFMKKYLAYIRRIACYEAVPADIREDIKMTFLAMAKNDNKGYIPFRQLLWWLGCLDDQTEEEKDQTVINLRRAHLTGEESLLEEGRDKDFFTAEEVSKNNSEVHTMIASVCIKELCMLIGSPRQNAVLEYYSRLQWDYLMLLKAEDYTFNKLITQLHNDIDKFTARKDTLYYRLSEYAKNLERYENLLIERNQLKQTIANLSPILERAQEKYKNRERKLRCKGIEEYDSALAAVMRDMMLVNKWKPLTIYYIDINDDPYYYIPIDGVKPIGDKLTLLYDEDDDSSILYEKKSDIDDLLQHLEDRSKKNLEIFREEISASETVKYVVYDVEIVAIRRFFMRQYILRNEEYSKKHISKTLVLPPSPSDE